MGGTVIFAEPLPSRWNYYEISWTQQQKNGSEECIFFHLNSFQAVTYPKPRVEIW